MDKSGEDSKVFPLVAAIYIGEEHSTYAWSLIHKLEKDPLQVSAPTWFRYTMFPSLQTRTCVLFTKDKTFKAFGYEAEEMYSELVNQDEHRDYYFFRKFRMKIFNQIKRDRNLVLKDEMGKTMSAYDVFSACIKYLCEHLRDSPSIKNTGIHESYFRWILIVPGARNIPYMQFLRTAAEQAGIKDEQLMFVSEPEAASLYCHYDIAKHTKESHDCKFVLFAPKTKYLVLDVCGDSIVLTVYEVLDDITLKKIFTDRCGNCGSNYINKAFIDFLADIFGRKVMDHFQTEYDDDYHDLIQEIQIKMRTKENENVHLKIPFALIEYFEQINRIKIQEHIATKSQYQGRVTLRRSLIMIDTNLATTLYKGGCESIINELKSVFKNDLVKDVPTILMVGGPSEYPTLQTLIKETFPRKKLIVPSDPESAVIAGAVAFGYDPNVIKVRVPILFSEK